MVPLDPDPVILLVLIGIFLISAFEVQVAGKTLRLPHELPPRLDNGDTPASRDGWI
jgi:hypothetical protein